MKTTLGNRVLLVCLAAVSRLCSMSEFELFFKSLGIWWFKIKIQISESQYQHRQDSS